MTCAASLFIFPTAAPRGVSFDKLNERVEDIFQNNEKAKEDVRALINLGAELKDKAGK